MSTETYVIKPIKMQEIEARSGRSFRHLDEELVRSGRSDTFIAEYFGISVNTLKEYRRCLGYGTGRCLVPAS